MDGWMGTILGLGDGWLHCSSAIQLFVCDTWASKDIVHTYVVLCLVFCLLCLYSYSLYYNTQYNSSIAAGSSTKYMYKRWQ
jgi:hypothetical protein